VPLKIKDEFTLLNNFKFLENLKLRFELNRVKILSINKYLSK
jgi:hypothetical protein